VAPAAVGVGHAAHGLAAAALQPLEFRGALVEFVVAHGVELHADAVERLHRRLVEEQGRDERRGADEVARTHHHVVGVLRLQPLHVGGQVFGAAHGRALRRRHDGVHAVGAGRLQVAVVVVEADDLDADRRLAAVAMVVFMGRFAVLGGGKVGREPASGQGGGQRAGQRKSAERHGDVSPRP